MDGESESISAPNDVSATKALIAEGFDESQAAMMGERVILVDENDIPIGSASKLDTHRGEGLLHRAFSVLLFDQNGRLLLQRRALDKITFPGIWANSCCSHPLHIESEMIEKGDLGVINAAIRKLNQELGIKPSQVEKTSFRPVGRFRYLARMNEEWVEHELDHVIAIQAQVDLEINPNEVHEIAWVSKNEFEGWCKLTRQRGETIAPWFEAITETFLERCWPESATDGIFDPVIYQLGDVSHMLEVGVSDVEADNGGLLGAVSRHKGEVETRIIRALSRSDEDILNRAMMHLIEGGGKRLRATLPAIVAEAVGNLHHGLYDIGAAIEIIHNFTLVHDDIMDDDEIRRGRPAVHVKYDGPTAINAGDAMLAVGFEVLAMSQDIDQSYLRDLVLTLSSMVRRVAEGQQRDIGFETRDDEVTEVEYLEMIQGKTAVMFETCGRVGALLSGADNTIVDIMTEWGLALGMCFQLMDDLIDVCSDSETLGKPAGSDVAQGKRTLMVIHALNQPEQPAKSELLAALGKGDLADEEMIKTAISALSKLGSISHARSLAEQYHAKAHACLDQLEQTVGIQALRELTDFQLMRMS